jgi:hypothetical protein
MPKLLFFGIGGVSEVLCHVLKIVGLISKYIDIGEVGLRAG